MEADSCSKADETRVVSECRWNTISLPVVTVAERKSFPKNSRLRMATDFRRVYDEGSKRVSRSFVLFALQNGLDHCRVGVTTPRKLGKAHDRNRIKRRVREILRTSLSEIPKGFDFVVNPKRSANERDFEELRKELKALLGVTG